MPALAQLSATFGKAGVIEFQPSPLGGIVAHLTSGESRATVALQGAQVLSWQPKGHDEALWLSPMARLGTGTPVRGGIPVCWPWFAVHCRGSPCIHRIRPSLCTGSCAHGTGT